MLDSRFSPKFWGGGGYLKIDSVVGNLIDWYNVQFYNRKFFSKLVIYAFS